MVKITSFEKLISSKNDKLKKKWIAKTLEFMMQSVVNVMSTMLDRQLPLFPKDGAFTNKVGRTWPPARQTIELKLNYANKHTTPSKNFKKARSIIFTDSTKKLFQPNY